MKDYEDFEDEDELFDDEESIEGGASAEELDAFLTSAYETPHFQDKLEAQIEFNAHLIEFRNMSFTEESMRDDNPLEILSLLVMSWPAADVRISGSYEEDVPVDDTSDDFMHTIAQGLQVQESKRSLKNKSVTFDILIQDNLDEFRAYNNLVFEHNENWVRGGCNFYDFDPVTGDEERIKDTWVDDATPHSLHNSPLTKDVSCGELTRMAPKMTRSKFGQIEYRVSVKGGVFTLGFIAISRNKELLYYNEISGKDLAKLVRRSVQELWGNYQIAKYRGKFYYGISQLLKGIKTMVCKDRKNTMPSWAPTTRLKRPTSYDETSSSIDFWIPVFRSALPIIICIYGILVIPYQHFINSGGSFLVTKMVGSIVLALTSIWFSYLLEEKSDNSAYYDVLN